MTEFDSPTTSALRRLILAIIFIGAAAMFVDLLLIDHLEPVWQWVPLAVLLPVIVLVVAVALRPGRAVLRAFQAAMIASIIAGLAGVVLHYLGNLEWEVERDPSLRGFALFWETIRGASPMLAPGAMVQLGLLGLAYAFRHPALRSTTGARLGADPATKEKR